MLDRLAQDLLERESLDGEEVYRIIRTMTGREPAPPREVVAGEGLVIGGHEVPEPVMAPRPAAVAAALASPAPAVAARSNLTAANDTEAAASPAAQANAAPAGADTAAETGSSAAAASSTEPAP